MTPNSDKFEFIFHRSHNLLALENSIEGIQEIISIGPKIRIEIDICTTADNFNS